MKKLDLSSVTSSIGLPIKSGTFSHLQAAYQEVNAASFQAMIGSSYDSTKAYILYGCANTGTGSNYIIGAGAIFFNGEAYLVPAATFTISGSNVAVGAITTSFYSDVTADPVQFTDGVNRNIHQIRQIIFSAALSGSGASDYLNLIDLKKKVQGSIGEIKMFQPPTGDVSWFDATGLGTNVNVLGWAICNGNNGTIDMRGNFPVGFNSVDADYSILGNAGGEKKHALIQAELPSADLHLKSNIIARYLTGVQGAGGTNEGLQPTLDTGREGELLVSLGGSNTPHENRPPYRTVLFIQRIS